MDFEIKGKEYPLKFGLKFIAQLDKAYTQNIQGMEFGMGVEQAVMYLQMKNPTALYEVIKASTAHLKSKPSNLDIENELEQRAENEELEGLFDDFIEAMESSVFLKAKFKQLQQFTDQTNQNENENQVIKA